MKYIPILLLSSLVLCIFAGCKPSTTNDNPTNTGTPTQQKSLPRTPDSIATTDGITLNIYDFEHFEPMLTHPQNDTVYVFNFWATWCGPCVKELPYFERLHKNYKDKPVKLILVSLDFIEQLDKKLVPFMKKHPLDPEVIILDQTGVNEWIGKINKDWQGGIPATLIVNKTSRKFYRETFEDFEHLESLVKPFL